MAVIYSVSVTSGIPSSGTGQVATINEFLSAPGTPNSTSVVTVQFSSAANSTAAVVTVSAIGVAQGSATTGQTGSLIMAAVSSNTPSYTNAQTSPVSVDTAGNVRTVITSAQTGFPVFPSPTTSGGYLVNSVVLSTTTNATVVATRAAQLYKVEGFNISSLPVFIKAYNLSTTPTAGTTTFAAIYTVPCSSQGAGLATEYSNGVAYGTGIGYTVTSSMSSSDTTVVQTLNAVTVNFYYK